jgi:arsenite methyltransferase
MSDRLRTEPSLDLGRLRQAIQEEYTAVARDPGRGYHFHIGRPLASMLGYHDDWLEGLPEGSIASFAGTGNPFRSGHLQPGEQVVNVGSGAGIDGLIAAKMVGPDGQFIGIDMTRAMLEMARKRAIEAGSGHVEFREGLAESLPVPDGWADVVISNGVLNLLPDKLAALQEMARVLKPGGRLQIGDILVRACGARGRKTADRSVDGLNCWCSAGSRTEGHGRGCRIR